jgi:hypothetical protein
MVLGTAGGFVTIEFGVVGLSLLGMSIALIAWKGPRLFASGGLLSGFGLLWTLLFARVALTCGAEALFPNGSCSTEDLTPWIAGSCAVFVAGLVLSIVAIDRRGPRRG